jgi:hypothetical protein
MEISGAGDERSSFTWIAVLDGGVESSGILRHQPQKVGAVVEKEELGCVRIQPWHPNYTVH